MRSLCKQLGENAIVYLTSRSEERGQQGLETLKGEGLSPRLQQLDVSDVASMERLRDFIQKEHGGLDILVNNAGVAYKVCINFINISAILKCPLVRGGVRGFEKGYHNF